MSQIKKRVSATVFAPNRLEFLTDGVFAIVMTLLVLEISIPEIAHSSLQAELPRRLLELWPKLYSYIISFLVLGILWTIVQVASGVSSCSFPEMNTGGLVDTGQ